GHGRRDHRAAGPGGARGERRHHGQDAAQLRCHVAAHAGRLMRRRPLDESDVRVRPGRGSRPRTKLRPDHADAVAALVTGVDRGRYSVLVEPDTATERPATAVKARAPGRDRIVVGGRVDVVGDTSGAPGTLARIVRVADRSTVLRRTADDTDPVE